MSLTNGIDLSEWFTARGYNAVHDAPREDEASQREFWTKSNKHTRFSDRDFKFFRRYIAIALTSGTAFNARGIHLQGSGWVHPDRAIMNSCLNAGLVELNESTGIFELTAKGLDRLELSGS